MGEIFKNEATAAERIGGPLPVYDASGDFATGLNFQHATVVVPAGNIHGSHEVETFSIDGGWVQAAADAIENGTSGNYRLPYSMAETNHDTIIGYRLSKVGYPTHYYWNVIKPALVSPYATAADVAALQALLLRVLGLLHRNARVDLFTYDGDGNMTSCRIRVFASKAAANAATPGAANDADGEIQRETIVGAFAVGLLSHYKLVEDL